MRRSTNVQDRRGMGGVAVGGGVGAALLVLVAMLLGVDPSVVVPEGDAGAPQQGAPPPPDDSSSAFVQAILGNTEDVWNQKFAAMGRDYQEPPLVLFSNAVSSACGFAQSAVGPFYCPSDRSVYIDLSFFRDLGRMGAPGDFAQAYVIAHEVGHHVQNQLGISSEVHAAQQAARSREEANALSVRLELQADCFAGVWGNHTRQNLEPGEVKEALDAASAIGDDRLQQESQGRVVPESFTHGSSEQRVSWFRRGFDSGDPEQCDTFAGGVR
ncbi:MAG TPA: neutral zinc metallopeptidase, partial [Longimicrobiaceae bacterium]|nr:neutral zinc metallopeptidase [Longimicrobiaceae bacterium]